MKAVNDVQGNGLSVEQLMKYFMLQGLLDASLLEGNLP